MTDTQFVDVSWGNEAQTYLRWNFHGNWTGQDYFDSLIHLWHLMDSKPSPLNLLIDMQFSGKNPSNLIALMQAAIRNKQPCNIKHIVVVATTSHWESIYNIARRHSSVIAALNVCFTDSDVEANNLLNKFGL